MAQTGYTPIQLYYSTTASAVPTNTNLANGELAINITDGKLYYKDNTGTVKLLTSTGSEISPITNNGVVYINGSGQATSGSALTYNGTGLGVAVASADRVLSVYTADATGKMALFQNGNTNTNLYLSSDPSSGGGVINVSNNAASAALPLIFQGNGAEQMRLTSTGLGIGTSSPQNKFVVSNAGAAGFEVDPAAISGATYSLFINRSTSAWIDDIRRASTYQWRDSAGSEQMRLDSSGNLGIGTSSPGTKLDVNGATRIRAGNVLYFQNAAADANATISAVGATGNSDMAINAGGGNVGIGTSSPADKLQVLGTIRFGANATYYGTITHDAASTGANIYNHVDSGGHLFQVGGTTLLNLTATGNLGLGVTPSAAAGYTTFDVSNATSGARIRLLVGSTPYGIFYTNGTTDVRLQTAASVPLLLGTNYNEYLRIAPSGAFGLSGTNYGSSGQVLTSQGSGSPPIWASGGGGSSQWTTSGSNIYYSSGGVGIGGWDATYSPRVLSNSKLYVVGGPIANTTANTTSTNTRIASFDAVNYPSNSTARFAAVEFYTDPSAYYLGDIRFVTNGTDGTATTGTERMRIDAAGRVGIGSTAATTNLARLQVDHSANADRYGVYVPGGAYVGSGPSGTQYGGWFRPQVSNATGSHVGVYGSAGIAAVGSAQYGGYFDGVGSASTPNYGVYGVGNQSDNNGPAVAYGGYFSVTTSNPSAGGSGGMVPVRAESLANKGGVTYAIWASTLPGPTTINGYYYEHNNALQCRIKSNGGIDNYSANNTNLSDRREKKDFAPAKSYLDVICSIPVQTFKYIDQQDDLPNLGVVAQDVQAVAPELVVESNWAKYEEEPRMRLSVYETDLVYALMKSLQELKAQFDEYKASHP